MTVSLTPHSPAAALLSAPVYGGYQYAYPHKTAYRRLPAAVPLREVWAREAKDALFLYVHVPFCEMRCGFCNLFTLTRAGDLVAPWLATLQVQAKAVAESLGPCTIARFAIGGGTPTFLGPDQLDALFDIARSSFGVRAAAIPTSIETSPGTATPERLSVLKAHGVERVSIGVESFLDEEAHAIGRPQTRRAVEAALGAIRESAIPTLNIDLIYGGDGQTRQSFLRSLEAALAWTPEEIYLYPLYVRSLTGLGRRGGPDNDGAWDARRLELYRAARDHLRSRGYAQISMRMFRRADRADWGPAYACTRDGMVGLGAGARSYAHDLHYSSEYDVGRAGVAAIVEDYLGRDAAALATADYGVWLSRKDHRRRFVILSLLQASGLSLAAYRQSFGASVFDDLPRLADLADLGWAQTAGDLLTLTEAGLERSDAIGPWLQTAGVQARMQAYALR